MSSIDKTLLDQLKKPLDEQISGFLNEIKELAKVPQGNLAMVLARAEEVDVITPKKRGRTPTSTLVGEIFFSLELPETCTNMDLDNKMLRGYTCEFLMNERLQNWHVEKRQRVSGEAQDTYFCHLTSQQKFRSKRDVIQFVLYESYHGRKKDPSTSRVSSKTRKRSYGPKEIEQEKKMSNDDEPKEN